VAELEANGWVLLVEEECGVSPCERMRAIGQLGWVVFSDHMKYGTDEGSSRKFNIVKLDSLWMISNQLCMTVDKRRNSHDSSVLSRLPNHY
jgi:hypothetical protein